MGTPRSSLMCLSLVLAAAAYARADVTALSLSPITVYGTDASTGTVTVDAWAFNELFRSVTFSSSNPAVASVPASISLRRPQTQGTFTITTYPVKTQTNVIITASEGGVSRQITLLVRPPILTGVTFNPNPLVGGRSGIATITCNRPAHPDWWPSIEGPAPLYFPIPHVVFAAGATSANVQVQSSPVGAPAFPLVTVRPPTGQAPNVTGTLQVVPIRVQTITLDPAAVSGGEAALGCVTLNAPAPAAGATVLLSSSDASVASVQPSVQIAGGDSDACFLVQSHATPECASATISAAFGGLTVQAALGVGQARQLTDSADDDGWGPRHSSTVGGRVLWTDGAQVLFNDGAATTIVQTDNELVERIVFGLGSGAAPGQVIGAWRRGSDFAWVWRSGGQPVLVNATNPIDANQPLNPEALAIADGAVFMALQAFANAQSVKHVFRIDPVSGQATNLTGSAAVPGAARIATAGGKAAWVFDDNSGNPKLHFYNGSSLSTIDSGDIDVTSLRLRSGRLVYRKTLGGLSHIYLYDSTLPGAAALRISPDIDATQGHFAPATDGRHIAWLTGLANGTNLAVMLDGGVQLSDAASRPANLALGVEIALQLHRGQLLWKNYAGQLEYAPAGSAEPLCLTPAAAAADPYLADGCVAWHGPAAGAAQTEGEIFRFDGATPNDADQPAPPILPIATAGNRQVSLKWDRVLGATSYCIYLAEQPGVTKANFASLPGGRRVAGVTGLATTVGNLVNQRAYYFVVTAVEGNDEGGESIEVSATPARPWLPAASGGFYAVAATPDDGDVAFAAAFDRIHKSTDGGFNWSALGGAQAGQRIRAVAASGDNVFGASYDGNVLRSSDAGANWAVVADGDGVGEINSSIAIDPSNPLVIYAGDMRLVPNSQSFLIKSIDGGNTWSQLPASPIGEVRAYALAIDPAGRVYAGGSGVPVARSDDGGATWIDLNPGVYLIKSIAIDPANPNTLYIGARDAGILKSDDAGATWAAINNGLPPDQGTPEDQAVNAIAIDPARPQHVFVGTPFGVYHSENGGASWSPWNNGLGAAYVNGLAFTSQRRLLAATFAGMFVLDLGCPGDADGSGIVDQDDIDIVLFNFPGSVPPGSSGDLDGDGDVDQDDIDLVLFHFGDHC